MYESKDAYCARKTGLRLIAESMARETRTKKNTITADSVNTKDLNARFRTILVKAESSIMKCQQRLAQLDTDIRTLTALKAPANIGLLPQKKKDREELKGKLVKLQEIRDNCMAQLGVK